MPPYLRGRCIKSKREKYNKVQSKGRRRLTTTLNISSCYAKFPLILKKKDGKNAVSELCFSIICIMHFDGWILILIPDSFVSAVYKRPVSSAVQATKRRLSKGRNGLSSQDPSIVLQIGSRWGSFGKFCRRKIAPPCSTCERQGGFTVGMLLRNSNTTHVWWDFWGMNAGPQKSCCGWLQLC